MFFFSILCVNLKAQNVQFFSSSCNTRSLGVPPAVCPPIPLCHGHGDIPGPRDCFGCIPTPLGMEEFPKASDYVAARKTSIITGNVSVSNNFIVDVPISFNGADVRLTDKAKITVNYNASMSSTGSYYYACEGMWEGIVANGTLSLQGGEIEDAKIAVQINSYSKPASIQGVTFKRNKIGIGFKGSTVKPPSPFSFFVFKQFSGNTFDCKERLNIDPSKPDAYRWGTAGITIQGGVLNINKGTGNTFKGKIRTGIEVINAASNISGCDFTEVDYTATSDCDETVIFDGKHPILGTALFNAAAGYGVYAERGTLGVTNCFFKDCAGGGVRAVNTTSNIMQNKFYFVGVMNISSPDAAKNLTKRNMNLNHLVYCELPGIRTTNVENNDFYPIWLMQPNLACVNADQSQSKVTVHNNRITFVNVGSPLPSAFTNGIRIFGQPQSSSSINTFVTKNTIDLLGSAINVNGILVEAAKYVSVGSTDVTKFGKNIIKNYSGGASSNTDLAGIYLLGSSECKVLNNEVYGVFQGTTHTKAVGIAYLFKGLSGATKLKSEKNVIANNLADKIHSGFVFEGACDNSQFYCNEMKDCIIRLKLVKAVKTPEPVIGIQLNNVGWNQDFYRGVPTIPTPYKATDAVHEGIKPSFSLFKYKTPGYPHDPQVVQMQAGFSKADWFVHEQVRENCGIIPNTFSVSDENSDLSALEDAIIRGLMGEEKPVFLWEYEKELYEKLSTNTALFLGHPEREAFFNLKSQSKIPAFNSVGKGIENLLLWSSADLARLNLLQEHLEYKVSQYNTYLEEALLTFGDGTWSEEAINTLDSYLYHITFYEEEIDTKLAQLKVQQLATANTLLLENNVIEAITEYEQDAKIVQKLWLKAFLNNGIAEANDLAQLRIIAAKCPTVSGASVYISRGLLPKCEQKIYDNLDNCRSVAPSAKIATTTSSATLYPNPANNEVQIAIPLMERIEVKIIDLNGRMVYQNTALNSEMLTINTSNFANGIYFVQFSDLKMQQQKLIIQH